MRADLSVGHALLALLSDGPRHGLQLRAEFAARTGEGRWPAGQVDAGLRQLERDGLVESDDAGEDGPLRLFQITADGERELAGWLRTPPELAAPPHAELAAKILLALRVPGTDVPELVQAHRRHVVELMQQWNRIKRHDAGHDLRLALAVDAQLFWLDSVIRWLDAAGSHLEAAASPPRPAAPDDRIRTSDADRESATVQLRDHYAEGRLTHAELHERVTAALSARTFGDLRRVLADLPAAAIADEFSGTTRIRSAGC